MRQRRDVGVNISPRRLSGAVSTADQSRLFATSAVLLVLVLAVGLRAVGFGTRPPSVPGVGDTGRVERTRVARSLDALSGSFVPNRGQLDRRVKYYAGGPDHALYLLRDGITHAFGRPEHAETDRRPSAREVATSRGFSGHALKASFIGANRGALLVPRAKRTTKVSYFAGKRAATWRTGLPTYGGIVYKGLYPGVDLTYRMTSRGAKYEYVLAPGADYEDIQVRYEGADSLRLGPSGDLVIGTPVGDLKDSAPHIYQVIGGRRTPVAGGFKLKGNRVGFWVGAHDNSKPLVIDPLLASTYLGGEMDDCIVDIELDSEGYVYVAGSTFSWDFPTTPGAYDRIFNEKDAFVAKLSPDLGTLIACTYLGGGREDDINQLRFDPDGNVYVVGGTTSSNFPVTAGVYDETGNCGSLGVGDGFVAKLSPNLTTLVASTYFGGWAWDRARSATLDGAGGVYIAGNAEFIPTTPGAYDTDQSGYNDAYVAKLTTDLRTLSACTYLGGRSHDWAFNVALAPNGDVYVSGYTGSGDFPTTAGAHNRTASAGDGFISRLSPGLSTLVASTFLGGSQNDALYSFALDTAGNVYAAGQTYSSDFPTTAGAFDRIYYDGAYNDGDAFVSKLSPSLNTMLASTFLGGRECDGLDSYWVHPDCDKTTLAVDAAGNVYVAGTTNSTDFPTTTGAFSAFNNGSYDGFVAVLPPDFGRLTYSTYLGGEDLDDPFALALDSQGHVYVAGETWSVGFPTTAGAYDRTYASTPMTHIFDGFITRLDLTPDISVPAPPTGLMAVPDDGKVVLAWTNPIDPDFRKVKIQRKTGGYPTGATDGTTVYDGFGGSCTDTGLVNGTTYYYSVFACDRSGNYSVAAEVSATPQAMAPPMPQPDLTVRLGENKTFTQHNYRDLVGTGSSDGTRCVSYAQSSRYQDRVSESWAGVRFRVLPAADGSTMSDATVSIRMRYRLKVNFECLPTTQHGGGSADVRLHGWIANYKKELANIVFLNTPDRDDITGTVTFRHKLTDPPTWTHFHAGQTYHIMADLYTHAQIYAGHDALAYGDVTVEEIKIDFREAANSPLALTLTSSPSLVSHGGLTTLSCSFTSFGDTLPNHDDVTVWSKPAAGGPWSQGSTATYDATSGKYEATSNCTENTVFQMRHVDDGAYGAVASNSATVRSYAYLPRPWISPTTPRRSRRFYVYGHLKPRHAGYTYLHFYRRVAGRWRYYTRRAAKNRNYRSDTRYRLAYALRYPGYYLVRAYHRDASHYRTYSRYRVFRVR